MVNRGLSKEVRFPLGRLFGTPGIQALKPLHAVAFAALLKRHMTGDFGAVSTNDDPNDREMNERAIKGGRGRIMSVYDVEGTTVWAITELSDLDGYTYTTVLLPSEY